MFKSFYFFLVFNSERGVAFSAEGFLYVYGRDVDAVTQFNTTFTPV